MFQHEQGVHLGRQSLRGFTIAGYVWPVIWRRDINNTIVAAAFNTQSAQNIAFALGRDTKHWAVTFYYSASATLPPEGAWDPWFTLEHLGSHPELTTKDCDFRHNRQLPTEADAEYAPKHFSEFENHLDDFRSRCQEIDGVYSFTRNNCQDVVNNVIAAFYA